MPYPRHYDDQPRCDECGDWAEWHDPSQSYLCDICEEEWNEAHREEDQEDAVEYIVTRIARQNPDIVGRKLFLTHTGLWTLTPAHARKFLDRKEAEGYVGVDGQVEDVVP